mgnify:CR=1 FL=1
MFESCSRLASVSSVNLSSAEFSGIKLMSIEISCLEIEWRFRLVNDGILSRTEMVVAKFDAILISIVVSLDDSVKGITRGSQLKAAVIPDT